MTLDESQVSVCDSPEAAKDESQITICDRNKPQERTVTICGDQDDCPEGTTPVSISGDTTPNNGNVYTATGGVGPFNFSASGGATMTQIGPRQAQINVDGTCGSGTVSVTDQACATSASMDVRFPSGQWVLVGFISKGDCTGGTQCDFTDVVGGAYYEGLYKFNGNLRCCQSYEDDCGTTTNGDTAGHDCFSLARAVQDDGKCTVWTCGTSPMKATASVYKWECS